MHCRGLLIVILKAVYQSTVLLFIYLIYIFTASSIYFRLYFIGKCVYFIGIFISRANFFIYLFNINLNIVCG